MSLFGRGTVLNSVIKSDTKVTEKFGEIPASIYSTVYDKEKSELTVFALNTSKDSVCQAEINLSSFEKTQMFYRTELTGQNLNAVNTLENQNAVQPCEVEIIQGDKNIYTVPLKPVSWNVIRFKV